jgi:hypothetical protein
VVAANGQYILVRRDAYESVGGHAAVADRILEDVALARAFRAAGYKVHFRYGAGAVRTRMYRNWNELREGWTKNLALLFPHPARRAAGLFAWWAVAWLILFFGLAGIAVGYWRTAYYVLPVILLYLRIARANFRIGANLLALGIGVPVFAYLLLHSNNAHTRGGVSWKGRTYSDGAFRAETKEISRPSGTRAEAVLESRH